MGRSESTVKSFEISKRLVFEAWEKVRVNDGAPGVDAVSVAQFGSDERNNLYKLWSASRRTGGEAMSLDS